MKNKMRISAAALFAFAALALYPARSDAGANSGTYPPSCTKYNDGSGSCTVSPAGLRASSDPNAWLYMQGSYTNSGYNNGLIYVQLNGGFYACIAVNNVLVDRIGQLLNHNGPMTFSWDASGTCYQVYSILASYYPN
jgi:hypothetical protein